MRLFNNRYTISGHPNFLCGLIDTRENTRPFEPCDHGRRYVGAHSEGYYNSQVEDTAKDELTLESYGVSSCLL